MQKMAIAWHVYSRIQRWYFTFVWDQTRCAILLQLTERTSAKMLSVYFFPLSCDLIVMYGVISSRIVDQVYWHPTESAKLVLRLSAAQHRRHNLTNVK